MTGLLFLIFMVSVLSLASYLYCWHDIRGGRPHILSLRQITTVMDRRRLNAIFGEPDAHYRYELPPPVLQRLVSARRGFFYGEIGADAACLIGSYLYLTGKFPAAGGGWFVLLAGLCQGINLAWSVWLVRRWSHQIREEMDGMED